MGAESHSCIVRKPSGEVTELDASQLDQIDRFKAPGSLIWLDLVSPGKAELELLSTKLALHPLALEDLENRRQRPKVDTYPGQYVIVAYEVLPGKAHGRSYEPGEIHMIATTDSLVTVHWAPSPVIEDVRERFRHRSSTIGQSTGGLLYAVLDGVADGYFPLLDRLSDQIEQLEERIVAGRQNSELLRDVLHVKRKLLELRRIVAPLRDVANALLRRDLEIVDAATVPYYQDLYDHLVRVLDSVDLYRDLVAAALDANLAVQSNSLNVIVKRLTAFTVLLMVPTLLAGIYGMNFDFMPELSWPWGYPAALGLMAASVIGLGIFFRSRDWF
ncbi:MAG TPA: magnesium/cobalt transporter CorA [Candidatus Limnocylindria bacterium]|jgi:magnesium transporter